MTWPPWAQTSLEQAIERSAICPYCGEIDWYGTHEHTTQPYDWITDPVSANIRFKPPSPPEASDR